MAQLQELRKKERKLISEINRITAMREKALKALEKDPNLDTVPEENNPWFLGQVIQSREDDLRLVNEEIRELTKL